MSILFAIVHFAIQPVENHMISDFTPPRLVSYAFGVKFALTFGVGAFGAVFGGYITDKFSTAAVFPALAGFVGMVVIIAGILALKSKSA